MVEASREAVAYSLAWFAFGELITLSEGRKDDEDFFEISFHFNLSFLRHKVSCYIAIAVSTICTHTRVYRYTRWVFHVTMVRSIREVPPGMDTVKRNYFIDTNKQKFKTEVKLLLSGI